jgi:hypothetical protein
VRDQLVARLLGHQRQQAVSLQEGVEHRGREHAERRHVDTQAGPLDLRAVRFEDASRRREPARLAAERSRADPADAARRVEEPALEGLDVGDFGDHTQPRSRHACATRLIAIT